MKNKILSHLRSFSHVVNFRASRFYKAKSWDLLLPRQKQKRNPLNVICSQILSICSLQFLVGFIVPANLSSKENNCPIVALTGINGLWRKPKNNKAFRLLRGFKRLRIWKHSYLQLYQITCALRKIFSLRFCLFGIFIHLTNLLEL